jgi:4-amino-4-deoxy-L-arabinose transferase-like glycosyltransferase
MSTIATSQTAPRVGTTAACLILTLVLARLIVAWAAPLAIDEAYYWQLSKNLAGGYYDHPPMVVLLIRFGTMLAGDTEFGVRFIFVLLGIPATWAVWRAAAILLRDDTVAATAALFFNLTMFVAVGTVLATPDAPLIVASAFVLYFLAKVYETGEGGWWLAVGAAAGLALLSKYTALFFALSIAIWLLLVPELRRWLLSPWPWLGGVVALGIFAPVLVWNAGHEWVSFLKQGGRVGVRTFSLRYLGEHLAAQFGMVTPAVFTLGAMGLLALLRGPDGSRAARVLIGALVWPLAIYFLWHSLHSRVEGNWTAPLIPAFVIAAAVAGDKINWHGSWARLAASSRRLAAPIALFIAGFVYLQTVFGLIPADAVDPTARQIGAGWNVLGPRIDALRKEAGAPAVLATKYGTVGWLSFYLPSRPPVIQVNERIRWVDAPEPDTALFKGPLLYVCKAPCPEPERVLAKFGRVGEPVTLPRIRRGVTIEGYTVWRVDGLKGELLDRSPPDELRPRAARPQATRTAAAPDR